jgi:hypothetical protein
LKNLFITVLLLGFFCGEAAGCSCLERSLDEFVNDADEVYFATLEDAKVVRNDADHKWPFVQGRFDVRRTLKGMPHAGDMMLQTGLGGGDCGVPMLVSQTYIIFKKTNMDGIGDCDGSHAIYGFEEDEIAAKVKAAMKKRAFKK